MSLKKKKFSRKNQELARIMKNLASSVKASIQELTRSNEQLVDALRAHIEIIENLLFLNVGRMSSYVKRMKNSKLESRDWRLELVQGDILVWVENNYAIFLFFMFPLYW